MKLEQLRPNLLLLPEEEAFALFQEYYDKRAKEIEIVVKPAKVKASNKGRKVTLTNAQLEMLKQLGLV